MAASTNASSTGVPSTTDVRRRNVGGESSVSVTNVEVVDNTKEKLARAQEKASQNGFIQFLDEWEFIIAPLVFTILAFGTRMYKIGKSNIVTWDEAHFGKFGSHYIKREFYFDVHPPLGKMLVGLSGVLAGYNGSFDFKSGTTYPEEINYTFMRLFNSAFGALLVPLAYFTAKELQFRRATVWLVALMVLCENSYATISRFILLDSMLLFFTFTTTFCWAKFHRLQSQSFSLSWFFWLAMTGLNIGCVCSVKWVGFFVTALVGLYTIEDLWNKFGDFNMPFFTFASHIAARVAGFIVIPFLVYMASFAAHFIILENSGPGDAQMSSLFQANLKGTAVGRDSPLEVAYGSKITLKNMGYGGGLLHSHIQTYPEGSEQQQITCYHHKDDNNLWFIYPRHDEPEFNTSVEAPLRYLHDQATIRFIHGQTGRNLHSHAVPAPITKADNEVSCYGNLTVGDAKDHWTVEVVRDVASSDRSKIRTLTTAFRLRHTALGCYLKAANVPLPQWGWKQIETTCTKKNNPRDVHTWWNIEAHTNDRLPPAGPGQYKSPWFRDFIHLNVAMMTSNNALVPDMDKEDALRSFFWQWPILNVGLRMCSWSDDVTKYYLLGNPVVYWGSTIALGLLGLTVAWYILRWQRGFDDLSLKDVDRIHYSALYPALGWFLHYFPFMMMGRVTYVHHYYPALYFAILTLGFMIDWFTRPLARRSKLAEWTVYFGLYALVAGMFYLFRAIVFGMTGAAKDYEHLEWLSSWTIANAKK